MVQFWGCWISQCSVLVTIKLIICCFFLFYLYMNFKPSHQTLPLKWFYTSHQSFTVEYFEPSCIPLPPQLLSVFFETKCCIAFMTTGCCGLQYFSCGWVPIKRWIFILFVQCCIKRRWIFQLSFSAKWEIHCGKWLEIHCFSIEWVVNFHFLNQNVLLPPPPL